MAQESYTLSGLTTGVLIIGAWIVLLVLIYRIDLGNEWSHWIIIAVVTISYLVFHWPASGNHLYAYIYLSLILFVSLLNEKEHQLAILGTNTKYLFTLIMLLAVIQKVITPGYLDGTINAFWLVNGGYFRPLYYFSNYWTEIVNTNYDLLNAYYNQTQTKVDAIILISPISNLRIWGIVLSIVLLAGELIVLLIFLLNRSQVARHGSAIILIIVIALTRQETGFLAILCIIGVSNCIYRDSKFRLVYITLFGFMQMLYLFDYGYK